MNLKNLINFEKCNILKNLPKKKKKKKKNWYFSSRVHVDQVVTIYISTS